MALTGIYWQVRKYRFPMALQFDFSQTSQLRLAWQDPSHVNLLTRQRCCRSFTLMFQIAFYCRRAITRSWGLHRMVRSPFNSMCSRCERALTLSTVNGVVVTYAAWGRGKVVPLWLSVYSHIMWSCGHMKTERKIAVALVAKRQLLGSFKRGLKKNNLTIKVLCF